MNLSPGAVYIQEKRHACRFKLQGWRSTAEWSLEDQI